MYDLRGSANGVNLRNLPASAGAPRVTTNLSVAQYQVRGNGPAVSGTATLNRSTVDGGIIGDGTVVEFDVNAQTVSYAARGAVEDLDVERVGRAFAVASIARPEYASRLTGTFDVKGGIPRRPAARRDRDSSIAGMTLDATGMLKNSESGAAVCPEMGFEAHLANGTLRARPTAFSSTSIPRVSLPARKSKVT